MKHLYIIGNGFDLHHGIPSGYQNYRQWLEENLGEKDIREYAEDVARENYPNFARDEFRDRDYHASEIVADDETFTVCSRISDTFGEWIVSLPEANENQRIWIADDDPEDKEKAMEFISAHHIKEDKFRLMRLNDILLSDYYQLKLEFE